MFGRSRSRLVALVLVIASVVHLPMAASAQGDSELSRTARATYTVVPDEGRVDAAFSYRFENPSGAVAFPGFFESLPAGAVEVAATGGGRDLVVSQTGVDGDTAVWFVQFAAPLDPGDVLEVDLTWSLTDSGRPGSLIRSGAVSIDLYAPGSTVAEAVPGAIEVRIPTEYESVDDRELVRPEGAELATVEASPDSYDVARYQFVDLTRFDGDLVDVPPLAAITSWPGDSGFVRAVTDRLVDVAPELDTWFGPRTDAFAVRRTLPVEGHPAVERDLVELVGDDAESIDHQLAHLWLADVVVDEDWFVEGLALGFAGEAGPAGSAEAMLADLVDQLGAAGVRAVVDALRAETSPYPGAVPEARLLPPDWRTVLDLVERVGGVADAASAFRSSVAPDGAARFPTDLIDRRAAAVVDHAALDERAGAWALPPSLRHAMATWDFDAFSAGQVEVSEIIVTRDEVAAWAESLELDTREDARALFEAAEGDQAETRELLAHQRESLEAFTEAERVVNGDRGLLARVGLWGSDPDGDLEELRELWRAGEDARLVHDAHELAETVENAVGRGTVRLLVPALLVIAVWQLVRWVRRRFGARDGDAQELNVSA